MMAYWQYNISFIFILVALRNLHEESLKYGHVGYLSFCGRKRRPGIKNDVHFIYLMIRNKFILYIPRNYMKPISPHLGSYTLTGTLLPLLVAVAEVLAYSAIHLFRCLIRRALG